MKDIYIVTHAEATHHVDGVVGGWFDSDLTERGCIQAEAIAAWIGMPIDAAGLVQFKVSSGSISVLRKDDQNYSHQVAQLGDVSHLA